MEQSEHKLYDRIYPDNCEKIQNGFSKRFVIGVIEGIRMLKVAVVGATGYTGEEIVKILIRHPGVEIIHLSAKIDRARPFAEIFPYFSGKLDLICELPDIKKALCADLVFLALPHRLSMKAAPVLIAAGKKVIDLSADYRLKDAKVYEKYYAVAHTDPQGLRESVYGLPELYREEIKKARLVANPGCYPTAVILAALPLLKPGFAEAEIIADAKTGVSGAGREVAPGLLAEITESIKAYKVGVHQHQPEIEAILGKVIFTPHLIPIERGILSTVYITLKKSMATTEVVGIYRDFYRDEPFVKVLDEGNYPQTKDVKETNFCHLGIKVDEDKKVALVISVIDNLVKGAAGQAAQNMNLVSGFEETTGLLV